MKNSLMTLALIVTTFFSLQAQETLNFEHEGKGYIDSWKKCIQPGLNYVKSGSFDKKAVDFQLNWDRYTDALELKFGIDFASNGYAKVDLGHIFQKGFRFYSYQFGVGVQERFVNGPIMLQAKCFPYAGIYNIRMGGGCDPKVKWGLCTQLEGGIKMFNINDATSVFLTLGYELDSPKFKVNKMFKEENGEWTCGLAFIW